jgi:hypothetical protein
MGNTIRKSTTLALCLHWLAIPGFDFRQGYGRIVANEVRAVGFVFGKNLRTFPTYWIYQVYRLPKMGRFELMKKCA